MSFPKHYYCVTNYTNRSEYDLPSDEGLGWTPLFLPTATVIRKPNWAGPESAPSCDGHLTACGHSTLQRPWWPVDPPAVARQSRWCSVLTGPSRANLCRETGGTCRCAHSHAASAWFALTAAPGAGCRLHIWLEEWGHACWFCHTVGMEYSVVKSSTDIIKGLCFQKENWNYIGYVLQF